jgi:HSP90 family molecular chaperone
MQPIKLSSKTLGHISSGLYRSTANALKELISNSFDADATIVEINTNYPNFDVLTCRDNGCGMTKAEFERLMDGGIGDSTKRTDGKPEKTPSGRPVIGRIGIGLLAIAQVCAEFKVVSHHRESKTAFEAVVNLRPYRRDEIASEKVLPDGDYEIGKYQCEVVDY